MNRLVADRAWHAKITAAVAAAEKKCEGEIVVALAAAADEARDVPLGLGAAVALGALATIVLSERIVFPHGLVLPFLAGAFLATFAAARWLDLPGRIFTTRARRLRAAREAARAAFFEHHVAATPERLGVLVHVSLREKIVEIVPDIGAEKVPAATWHAIAHRARHGRIEESLLAAIGEVGDALATVAPAKGERATSALDDEPRIET
jgi:uncharacterized membrane protein